MITFTDQEIQDWKAAPYRPNGRHEAAYITPRFDLLANIRDVAAVIDAQHPAAAWLSGADTIRDSLNLLPAGLDAYGSYVDNFGGWAELLGLRGQLGLQAVYFSYTIFGGAAHFADVEPGAMHPADLARNGTNWLVRRGVTLPGNTVPGVYTSAGNADLVFGALGLENLPHDQLPSEFIYQSAHYGAGRHICHPNTCGFRAAHGTQCFDTGPGGENYDRALWWPNALGRRTQPPPPPEEEMLTSVVSAEGHLHVFRENPDGSVDYTYQLKDERTWSGGAAGKQIAKFEPFAPARGK